MSIGSPSEISVRESEVQKEDKEHSNISFVSSPLHSHQAYNRQIQNKYEMVQLDNSNHQLDISTRHSTDSSESPI